MATYPDVQLADLQAAYRGWPGSRVEKAAIEALVLRVRIERAAANLPRTVIAAKPDISMIERRLYLSIGEPALSPYAAICEILHGRTPDPMPSLQDLDSWASVVDALEEDFVPAARSVPSARTVPLPKTTSRPIAAVQGK